MTIAQQQKKLNMSVMIDGIKFNIVDISQEIKHQQINYGGMRQSIYIPTHPDIKITAKTATSNYILLEKWTFDIFKSQAIRNYKKDINIGSLKILGVYPIDYTFNNYNIDVTLSADYISGDLNQAYLHVQRKEKLKKLNEINGRI